MTDTTFGDDARPRENSSRRFRGRYLSITSFRRDGTPVASPVWFAEGDGRLLVQTDAASGKVKRIRRDSAVQIAICSASGRLRGEHVPAVAELLPDTDVNAAERLIRHKYRTDLLVIAPLRYLQSALHLGRPRTRSVILAITPR